MTDEQRAHIMDGVYKHPRRGHEWKITSFGEEWVTLRCPAKPFLANAVVPADGFLDFSSWERIQ
jgi:hypothetical protein